MNFHARLLAETEQARQHLQSLPVLQRALRGAITRPLYRDFLGEAYHHVRHTTSLLMACGARLPARLEWLREAVAHYIEEEIGHQEWILDDLVALGESRQQWASSTPSFETELMVSYAWDTVQRGNPVGFFGMVLVLEGTSAALASNAAVAIEQGLRLPRNAFSYLRSHGDLDKEHVGFFADLMDRLDKPSDQAAVIHAARCFYRLYGDLFRGLDARHAALGEAA